jgi:hypothetical protein
VVLGLYVLELVNYLSYLHGERHHLSKKMNTISKCIASQKYPKTNKYYCPYKELRQLKYKSIDVI